MSEFGPTEQELGEPIGSRELATRCRDILAATECDEAYKLREEDLALISAMPIEEAYFCALQFLAAADDTGALVDRFAETMQKYGIE